MTTPHTPRALDEDNHHEHAHLDGGRCLDGTGRTWKPAPPSEAASRLAIARAGLGPGHDVGRCSVCRGQRRAVVDVALVLALGCLLVLLLGSWFLPPAL